MTDHESSVLLIIPHSSLPHSKSLSSHYFQQELQNLHVALGLGQAVTPSVQSMAAKQKAVGARVGSENRLDDIGQPYEVLRIIEDGQPLAVLVRRDALQTFQHFVAFNGQTRLRAVAFGKKRAPDGVGVQDGPHAPRANDGQV